MTITAPAPAYRIGVDVGGTNTDAAILDLGTGTAQPIVGASKRPTTPDVAHGIHYAIDAALVTSRVARSDVEAVVIGTTSFVNSLVECDVSRLERVAVIRLCGPFTRLAPPFISFPYALRRVLEGPVHYANGGLQVDGSEIAPVDPEELKGICEVLKEQGVTAVVISACYSPIDQDIKQEEQVRDIAQAILPNARITISKDVAHIGLLQRENAAILNAALRAYAERTVAGFQRSTASLQLDCPLWLTSNDGTLMSCEQAAQYPIRTFSSGPTNSMRGASFLANLERPAGKDKETALVIDVGGTTTEIGVLLPSGFPRQAAATHELCGVSLNFAMPHVHSIGLGGGSKVRSSSEGPVTIGPDSVAYRLDSESRCFGGSTTTATDIMVAAGAAKIGTRPVTLDVSLLGGAQAKIKAMIEVAIDTMKTSSADIPVYLVGGGAFLVPSDLRGVSTVYRFPFADAANAVGAACAQVSGMVDTYEDTSSKSVAEVQRLVEGRAIKKAMAGGADPAHTVIVESECIPIAYTTGRARFCVKAAGPWSVRADTSAKSPNAPVENGQQAAAVATQNPPMASTSIPEGATDEVLDSTAIQAYRPNVEHHTWLLSETDVEWIATGCYILGTGGGGNPETIYLAIREQIRAGADIKVIDAESMDPDSVAAWGGGIGSPEVGAERLVGGDPSEAIRALLKFCQSPKLGGLVAVEIGGGNGMINMLAGASTFLDAPIIDGDFMGRAYPTGWQVTPNVYDDEDKGANLLPNAMASGDGNVMFMTQAKHYKDVDKILRAGCIEMGTAAAVAGRPYTKAEVSRFLIRNTVSQAWRLGRAVALARCQADIGRIGPILVDALGGDKTAKVLFAGKIVSVGRRLHKGHSLGEIEIHPINSDEVEDRSQERFTGVMKIPFMNENLLCEHVVDGTSKIVAGVPDLICVLDAQNGSALGTPEYKYGQRVLVLGTVGAPQWTDTERGLELGSLKAFGYNLPYEPLGVYVKPRSVIEEYR